MTLVSRVHGAMMAAPLSSPRRSRITKACDRCHRRGRKCRLPESFAAKTTNSCLTCVEYGAECTWTRASAKRGMKPRRKSAQQNVWVLDEFRHGSRESINMLIEVFFRDIYPIVCTVNEQKFMTSWSMGLMPSGQSSYARLMAICAFSCLRIENGSSTISDEIKLTMESRSYLDESCKAIAKELESGWDLEMLQAIHLICVVAMESGQARRLHHYLGVYHAAVAELGFSEERRWPDHVSTIEKDECRRLFWHMYRLEVHTSLIIGHMIRCPEAQVAVAYPDLPDNDSSTGDQSAEWLSGWNFVTDLYRGLEHLIVQFRAQRMSVNRPQSFNVLQDTTKDHLMHSLEVQYVALPERLRQASAMRQDKCSNRCGFQVANIICEYHLAKIVSYACDNDAFRKACDTVTQLIEDISTVPVDYLQAMSRAMLQEISGFGHILSSFIGKDLSTADYEHLRRVMLCIAEFLESLSSRIPSASGDAAKIKEYVAEIDHYLTKEPSPHPESQIGSMDDADDMTTKTPSQSQMFMPFEYLDRMLWPSEWVLDLS